MGSGLVGYLMPLKELLLISSGSVPQRRQNTESPDSMQEAFKVLIF